MVSVLPVNDIMPHDEFETTCPCGPTLEIINGEMLLTHNSFDGRELKERKRKMHYRDGSPAQNGDQIVQLGDGGKITAVGILHGAVPGNDYCNGHIASTAALNQYACMCDCLPMSAIAAMLKEKGLDVRPKGK